VDISPEDIERAVFKERFRGYDQDEVDRFLDLLAQQIAVLQAERDELAAQVVGGPARAESWTPQDDSGLDGVDQLVKRTLSAAQRTAEELIADARTRATEMVEDSRRRVLREREQLRTESELIRRAADELRNFRDEYRGRLHAVVSEQLAALDRAGELPRLPASVDEVVVSVSSPDMGRRPSPAQAWADAAAEEPEVVSDQWDDEVAAPWDDLWEPEAPAHKESVAGTTMPGDDANGGSEHVAGWDDEPSGPVGGT